MGEGKEKGKRRTEVCNEKGGWKKEQRRQVRREKGVLGERMLLASEQFLYTAQPCMCLNIANLQSQGKTAYFPIVPFKHTQGALACPFFIL